MATIINGKELAAAMRRQIAAQVQRITEEKGVRPGLAVIQVGEDPASSIYVRNKQKACSECGIQSFGYELPADAEQKHVLELIETLNHDEQVSGILCQLPLPAHLDEFVITQAIRPEKDVDGFHAVNIGLLSMGRDCLVSCTPSGIMAMLRHYEIPISGQRCVIIGRSNIVGKPVAQLMLNAHATVTVAHSRTRDLPALCRQADILISAVGRAGFVTADFVKPGAAVIDVGINRGDDGKVTGDVDFPAVKDIAAAITPVPGGVGPMTITMLLENTVKAFLRQHHWQDEFPSADTITA